MYVMKLKYLIAPFVLAAAALCGCQETAEIHPVAYMTDAQKTVSKSVTIDTPPAGTEISVSSSVPVNKDTKIKISLRPDLLEEYNAKYQKNYVVPPADSYTLSGDEVVISAGYSRSSEVDFTVTSLDDFQEGTTYCMPVSIERIENSGLAVLEPSRTLFIVLKTPVISKAIYLGSSNIYKVPSFQEDANLAALKAITLEARVYMDGFQNYDPYISSIMGIEGECGVRFGDVKVPKNVLQICHGDYQPAATSKPFDTGKWYHVAAVWSGKSWDIFIDGVYVTGVATQGETINLSSDNSGGFYLGASYGGGRPLNGYVAECRVWTRALTEAEISNNMNYVNPESDGLLAYWRMNAWEAKDGGGNIVKDLTGHGYDAVGGSSNPRMISFRSAERKPCGRCRRLPPGHGFFLFRFLFPADRLLPAEMNPGLAILSPAAANLFDAAPDCVIFVRRTELITIKLTDETTTFAFHRRMHAFRGMRELSRRPFDGYYPRSAAGGVGRRRLPDALDAALCDQPRRAGQGRP